MPGRIDHVAFETLDPRATAAFYERLLGARVVSAEGHPVMAYVEAGGFAFHQPGGVGFHVGIRVSEEDRSRLRARLEAEGIPWEERDHGIATGLFFQDPDGRTLEAITYRGAEDRPRP